MKTSELKKWLDEKGWIYEEDELSIIIHGVLVISKNHKEIEFYYRIWSEENGLDLLNKVLEYTNTPISEREDEKKYRIELAEICEGVLSREGMSTKIYSMSSIIKSTESTKIIFKEIFTQQEIDNFPAEIKGAIECGFLRKVEVE